VVSDLLIKKAIKGESSAIMSLTSHVGAISSWHVFFGAELISFATSSTVTAVKSASDEVTRRGTSYNGVATVDRVDRVVEILGEMFGTKWTVVVTGGITQCAVESPPEPLSVAFINADLVSPVSVVLVGVQRPHRLHPLVPLQLVGAATTSSEAPLSSSCESTSSRQSASNHGVAFFGLRHTFTAGQCLSSRPVRTSR